jgi:hypothetical protein
MKSLTPLTCESLEGSPLPKGVTIEVLMVSPDGKRIAFTAARGKKKLVCIGSTQSEPFDKAGLPRFSPDGENFAYQAKLGRNEFMIVGRKRGKAFQQVGWPNWSPSGKMVTSRRDGHRRWSWAAIRENGFIVFRGRRASVPTEDTLLTVPAKENIGSLSWVIRKVSPMMPSLSLHFQERAKTSSSLPYEDAP